MKKPNHISKSQLRLVIVTVTADLKVRQLLKGQGRGDLANVWVQGCHWVFENLVLFRRKIHTLTATSIPQFTANQYFETSSD